MTVPAMLAPPVPVSVKVVVLMVTGFIAVLNVAVMTAVLGQVMVEPLGGVTAVTVGAGQGGEVVNDQVKFAVRPLPNWSWAPNWRLMADGGWLTAEVAAPPHPQSETGRSRSPAPGI